MSAHDNPTRENSIELESLDVLRRNVVLFLEQVHTKMSYGQIDIPVYTSRRRVSKD